MVRQSPDLSKRIRKRKTDLYFGLTMSKFQALGKNSDTLDGLNAHLIIVDELRGIKDRQLYEVMQQSQSVRRQPLLIMITTAGTVRECIFDDMYTYAYNIVDGKFKDDSFLPILYELDSPDEWRQPEAWAKANPGLGVIKKLDDLQRKVDKAKNSPKDLNGILTKDFNIRNTITSAWLSFDDINNEETFSLDSFKNCYAIGGADLSITTDLMCATLLMLDKATGQRCIHQMYWLPSANFEKRVQQDRVPYDVWLQQRLGADLQAKKVNYNNNPILKWCLTNTGIVTDRNGNITPVKTSRQGRELTEQLPYSTLMLF